MTWAGKNMARQVQRADGGSRREMGHGQGVRRVQSRGAYQVATWPSADRDPVLRHRHRPAAGRWRRGRGRYLRFELA